LNSVRDCVSLDPEIVEEIERDGVIQPTVPLPWHEAELEFPGHGLGLPGDGVL
jgi:hypothetical protein